MNNTEIITLFEKIYKEAYESSGNALNIEVNGEKMDIQSIHRKVRNKIKSVNKHEKTAFLTVPILEDAFSFICPLLLLPAAEIVSGDMHRIEDIKDLLKSFKESNVKEMWKEKKASFHEILKILQLETETDIYNDLADISEILMKALLFFDGFNGKYGARVYQYASGVSSPKRPMFANDVSIYTCANDFVTALKNNPCESIVAFGAVRMTEAQTNDYFYDYCHGYDNERKRNGMRNDHMTEEEYFASEDRWKRMVYLGIKNGGNIYLVPSSCNDSYSYAKEFYSYGERKTYFPYQVLFDEAPDGNKEMNQLAVFRNTWRLQDILDDEQRVYIPVLLGEVLGRFFGQEPEQLELTIAPQTTVLQIAQKQTENMLISKDSDFIIYKTPSTEELFKEEPWMLTLINALHITEEDISHVPLLPTHECLETEYRKILIEHIAGAYRKVIQDKLKALADEEQHTKLIQHLLWDITKKDQLRFMKDLEAGRYASFSNDIVNGITGTTQKNDSTYMYRWTYDYRFVLTYDSPVNNRPPVCIKVRPKTKAAIISFYALDENELPFLFKYRDEILSFHGNNSGEKEGAISIPGINVLMGKKVYKNTLEQYLTRKDSFEMMFSGKHASELSDLKAKELEGQGFEVKRIYNGSYTIYAKRQKGK